jgi:hypothetical protein
MIKSELVAKKVIFNLSLKADECLSKNLSNGGGSEVNCLRADSELAIAVRSLFCQSRD